MDLWIIVKLLMLHHHVSSGYIVNVALNKPASMSSSYGQGSLKAGGAVDGNKTAIWPNIINTAENQPSAWWKVDLEREVQDATVRIYFRTDFTIRRNGVKLYTSTRPFPQSNCTSQGQLCHTVSGSPQGAYRLTHNIFSIRCLGRWRYLMLYTNTPNDGKGAVLDFGEVEVDACSNGNYGVNCSKSCSSRHCTSSTPSTCDPQTGRCPGGCQPGWTGVDCTRACSAGVSYGHNCSKSCSSRHCVMSSSECYTKTGQCTGGCEPGWTGVDCTQNCSQCKTGCDRDPEQCHCGETGDRSECEVTGQSGHIISGHLLVIVCAAGGGGVVLVVIVIGVVYKRKKRRITRARRPRRAVEDVPAVNGEQSIDAPRTQVACLPLNAEHAPVHAAHAEGDAEEDHLPVQDVAACDADAAVLDVNNRCVYYNIEEPEVEGEIAVAVLESTVARIAKRKGFNKMFESLPEGFLAPYEDSRLPVNAGKNKYKEYYPYDHNRVRLSLLPDVSGSDYINASIMHLYNNDKTYIAAQAPNKKTVGDFWRMIWEQRCGRVVMLTGLVEGKITKCYKYWSDESFLDTDQFHVELTSVQQRANYTVRYFQLSSYKTGESRSVVQYHYTTWSDHGVPDTLALVNFIWMMRRTHIRTDGPLLVHCSAGIGRTGTYIAVDSLLDQAREEGKVDVQGYVSMMREQRKNMIQTTFQYECVFNCLVEMTKYGNTSLTVDDFTTLYTNSGMGARVESDSKSFRELTQMLTAEERKALQEEHRLWVDGNQNFLVVALPSLRSVRGHLLCESPHPGQEKLLWKLVEENNVNNVIVLSNVQHFMDLTQESGLKVGEITVTALETRRMESELFVTQLKLENNRVEHNINLFRLDGHVSIGSVSARVLDHASLRSVASEVDPVLIVYSPSDQHVAVSLTILLNVLSELLADHRVDITGHIRTSLWCCPQLTLSEHEMEELHNIALRCVRTLEADKTYANM